MGFVPWLIKAALSALYWFVILYMATGIYFGDKVTPQGIVAPDVVVPLWIFWPGTLLIYAVLSMLWDRLMMRGGHASRRD